MLLSVHVLHGHTYCGYFDAINLDSDAATPSHAHCGLCQLSLSSHPGRVSLCRGLLDLQGWAAHRVLPPLGLFPNLREVRVQQNGIRELPVAQITPLVQLQTLDISMNDVSLLPPRPGTAALAAAPVDHRESDPAECSESDGDCDPRRALLGVGFSGCGDR